jgi:hypothetical protein
MGAGVLFVVLFVVGVLVSLSNEPEIKKKDTQATAAAKYVKYLSDSGHRAGIIIGAYVVILSALAFVWFTQALRSSLVVDSISSRVVSSIGILGGAAISVGAVLNATPAGAHSIGNEPLPAGDTIRAVMDLFVPCVLLIFGLVCALIATIMAIGLLRAGTFPRWLAYTAWLAVLGGLAGIEFLPLVVTLLWFLAVAIVGLVRPPAAILAVGAIATEPGAA